MRDADNPLDYVRELARSHLYYIEYHAERLATIRSNLTFAKELLKRCGIDEDGERLDSEDLDNENFVNVEQFALHVLDSIINSIEYHENALPQEHRNLAFVKIMLARGDYQEIDIDEIEAKRKADKESRP